jgi:hypothetical protein
MSVVFERTTRRCILGDVALHEGDMFPRNVVPEDSTLHRHRLENYKLVVLNMLRRLKGGWLSEKGSLVACFPEWGSETASAIKTQVMALTMK